MTELICGVDVSADTLDARIGQDGAWQRFNNTADGIEDLAQFCRHHAAGLVVMEAPGGYERQAFGLLWAKGVPAAVVNPRAVRRFAQAMGCLEKTDRIDCAMVAWYAQTKRIQPTPPPSATQARLTAMVTRLRQLTELRVAQQNQQRLVTDPDAQLSFAAILAVLAEQTRFLERKIADAIATDPVWNRLDAALRSIKGVADRTVARIMAGLPEIGTLSNKACAKLAGLAPLARDSGKHAGKRCIGGGRESVRSILFVVAEVVRRHDPDFAAFHQRLTSKGKPRAVVRIALAHKLLVHLNARARHARHELAQTTQAA